MGFLDKYPAQHTSTPSTATWSLTQPTVRHFISSSHPLCALCLELVCRYLPASTWQLELFLALFSTLLLFLLLTHRVPPLSQINLIPTLTIPLSTILLLDSYLTLSTLEQRYSGGEAGSAQLDGSGWTLNARRFREQRDVYLALFTIVVGVTIRYVNALNGELSRAQSESYRLRVALDRHEGKRS